MGNINTTHHTTTTTTAAAASWFMKTVWNWNWNTIHMSFHVTTRENGTETRTSTSAEVRFNLRNRKPEVNMTYWPEPDYREAGIKVNKLPKKFFEIFKKVCKNASLAILFVLNQYCLNNYAKFI